MSEKQYVVHRIEKQAADGKLYLTGIDCEAWHWRDSRSAHMTFSTREVAKHIAAAWNARPQSIDLAFFEEVET